MRTTNDPRTQLPTGIKRGNNCTPFIIAPFAVRLATQERLKIKTRMKYKIMEEKYKDYNTAYCSDMRVQGCQKEKGQKADEHNLRLVGDITHVNAEWSENNKYLVPKETGMNPYRTVTDSNEVKQMMDDIIDKTYQDYIQVATENGAISQRRRTQLNETNREMRRKFQNTKSGKTTGFLLTAANETERSILQGIYDKLVNDEDVTNNDLERYKIFLEDAKKNKIKIKLEKNKIKTIQDAINRPRLKNSNISKKIVTNETVLKIPDDNKISLPAKSWLNISHNFVEQFYPDHDVLYIAMHEDENPNNIHPHIKINGFNKKSKEYDLPDALLKTIKERLLSSNKEIKFPTDKKWCEFEEADCKAFGEAYQSEVYDFLNKQVRKYNIEVNFKRRSQEQKEIDNHVYDKKRPLAKREHNRAQKLKKENDNQEESIKENREKLEELRYFVKESQEDLKESRENQNIVENNIDTLLEDENILINSVTTLKEEESILKKYITQITELSLIYQRVVDVAKSKKLESWDKSQRFSNIARQVADIYKDIKDQDGNDIFGKIFGIIDRIANKLKGDYEEEEIKEIENAHSSIDHHVAHKLDVTVEDLKSARRKYKPK